MFNKFRRILITVLVLLLALTAASYAEIYSYWHIQYATEGPIISDIQNRLTELGYPYEFTEGVYDLKLQEAIEKFCEINGIDYDRSRDNGITPGIQSLLMEGDPKPYSESKAQGIIEIAKAHLLSTITVFNLIMPMYLIWFAALILIIILILIIAMLSGGKKKSVKTKNEIEFTIEYGEKSEIKRLKIEDKLIIGRDFDILPVHQDDLAVSRKHCEIYKRNGVYMLRDFSSNGTSVNGKLCSESEQLLSSGDTIAIGMHKIKIRL